MHLSVTNRTREVAQRHSTKVKGCPDTLQQPGRHTLAPEGIFPGHAAFGHYWTFKQAAHSIMGTRDMSV